MALFKKVFDTHSDALARGSRSVEAGDTVADLRNIFAVEDETPHDNSGAEDSTHDAEFPATDDTHAAILLAAPDGGVRAAEDDSFDFAETGKPRTDRAFVLSPGLRTGVDDAAPLPHLHRDDASEPDTGRDPAELARRQIEAMHAQEFATDTAPPSCDPACGPRAPAGRVRTRLLGFTGGEGALPRDPMQAANPAPMAPEQAFPVGWIVVARGPGRGAHFALTSGVSLIGRGDDNSVCLDFGDTAISRRNHAAIAYDDEAEAFYLGHGGKSNIIRLNGRPVLSTEEMHNGDEIRIGETVLRLVALCGADFTWNAEHGDG